MYRYRPRLPQAWVRNFIKEIGRAGRDGQKAFCHSFMSEDDFHRYLLSKAALNSRPRLRSYAYSNGVDTVQVKKFLCRVFQAVKGPI